MRTPICLLAIIGLAVFMSAGCAGQKAAQETARVLVGQTLTLEQDINQKIAAETRYYSNSVAAFQAAAERESSEAKQLQLNSTAASFASQVMNSSKSVTANDIASFLNQSTAQTWAASSNVLAEAASDESTLRGSLRQLNSKMQELESLRTTLENLQNDPDVGARSQELLTFANQLKAGITNQVNPMK